MHMHFELCWPFALIFILDKKEGGREKEQRKKERCHISFTVPIFSMSPANRSIIMAGNRYGGG